MRRSGPRARTTGVVFGRRWGAWLVRGSVGVGVVGGSLLPGCGIDARSQAGFAGASSSVAGGAGGAAGLAAGGADGGAEPAGGGGGQAAGTAGAAGTASEGGSAGALGEAGHEPTAGAAGVAGAGPSGGAAGSGGAKNSCENGILDAGETDVDCGLSCPLRCATGQRCALGADCSSGYCGGPSGDRCVPTHCADAVLDADETGIDCGGSCLPCAEGLPCFQDTDCAPGLACGLGECRTAGRSCLDIHRRVPSAPSGVFVLDPDADGPIEPFLAPCDMTSDGGGWTEILRADAPYQPTAGDAGNLGVEGTSFAKLADARIQALAPASRTFRLRGNADADALYFLTAAPFVDTAPSWGMTAEAIGLVAFGASLAGRPFRQVAWASATMGALDTVSFKLTPNDCSRLFVDVGRTVGCDGGEAGKRCVGRDASPCSSGGGGARPFRLWLREWSPAEGLLLNQTFDEGTGDTAGDSSGNGLVGTLAGAGKARPTWVTAGHRGGALSFDGKGHTHVLTSFATNEGTPATPSEKVFLPTANTTFSLWYRTAPQPQATMRLLGVTGGGFDRSLDFVGKSTDLSAYWYTPGAFPLANARPDDDDWHHLVWTFHQGVGSSIYLDGELRGSSDKVGACGKGCSNFYWATEYSVGTTPTASDPAFTGQLDDSRAYRMPLLPADVKQLYESQK
jgi:hypothetical protein